MLNGFEQKPIAPNEWLYEDKSENVRNFWKVMFIPDGGKKLKECTNEEKEKWEEEHKEKVVDNTTILND